VGDAVGVALDGDWSGEARDRDGAVELRKGVRHRLAEPVAGGDEADDGDEQDEGGEDDDDADEDAAAPGLEGGLLGSEGVVGDDVGVGEVGQTHGLMASVNGVVGEGDRECAAATPSIAIEIWFTGVGAVVWLERVGSAVSKNERERYG
jgi:hypothetical protein